MVENRQRAKVLDELGEAVIRGLFGRGEVVETVGKDVILFAHHETDFNQQIVKNLHMIGKGGLRLDT